MSAIRGAVTLAKVGLETNLGREVVTELAEGVAARAGAKLIDEALAIGSQTRSKGTIQTMADMFGRKPGEVVTEIPRRFITGSAEEGIRAKTVSIDVLHPDELFARVSNQRVNADLFKNATGNADLRRLHYLNPTEAREQAHVTLSVGNRIAGIGGVRSNRMNPSELWVDHISVEAKHQGNGYARNIIESIYDYALRRNQQVVPSSFSTMGQRIKQVFSELNTKYPQAASSAPFRDL